MSTFINASEIAYNEIEKQRVKIAQQKKRRY